MHTSFIIDALTNPILLSGFFASAVAQAIKSLVHLKKTGQYDWRWLFRDAGMPSAHTATVTAMTLAVYFDEGFSNLFFVSLILSSIVIRDVLGDKIFAEKTEDAINEFLSKIQHFFAGERVEWKHFIGHTIREVIAGFAVGVAVALIVQRLIY